MRSSRAGQAAPPAPPGTACLTGDCCGLCARRRLDARQAHILALAAAAAFRGEHQIARRLRRAARRP